MRYDIHLSIGYRYGAPSDHSRAIVRLLPSDIPGRQVVTSRLLAIDPLPGERRETLDFFGNATTVLAFHEPVEEIELILNATAERIALAESLDLSPDLGALAAEVSDYRSLDPASPHHFLGASSRVAPDPAISAFAAAQAVPGLTARQLVIALGGALHAEMRFDPDATDATTAPGEAFANRHGVCQDFSHIMIAALRSLGVPAGYVSGFLRTLPPPGKPRLEGADAMHAWVSAWCGSKTGWIEFDPTNACPVGSDHIAVAYGRDYLDVSPVRGVLRTSGAQTSHQNVDVIPL